MTAEPVPSGLLGTESPRMGPEEGSRGSDRARCHDSPPGAAEAQWPRAGKGQLLLLVHRRQSAIPPAGGSTAAA